MPSAKGLFADLLIMLDKVDHQYKIWNLEKECGMETNSLSFWGFQPEYNLHRNLDEFKKHFTWNSRQGRFEDGL